MATVKVYNFRKYDINKDGFINSSRMATREAVEKLGPGFVVIEGSEIEINPSELDPKEPGMTGASFGFFQHIKTD